MPSEFFGRTTKSLRTLKLWTADHPEAIERANIWLNSESAYLLFWRSGDGPAAVLFSDNQEDLLHDAMWRMRQAAGDPKEVLLMGLTGTELDKIVENAWAARGGFAVPW